MKLKANTSLIVIIAAAVLLELISAVQYYYTRSLLADELELRAESELTTKAVIVKSALNLSETSLRGHIWDVKRNMTRPDSLFGAVEWVLRTHPRLFGCGLCFVPHYYPSKGRLFEPYSYRLLGEVRSRQLAGPHHDYTRWRGYREGIASASPFWTDPYRDSLFRIPMVSYVVPLLDASQQPAAVFVLDIPVSILGDTLNYRHLYPSSFDFLLTHSGELIAGPRDEAVRRETMEQVVRIINDSTVTKTLSKSGRSRVATFRDATSGDQCYVFFANFKGQPDWQIGVVCYDREVYAKLRMMRLNIGVLMLAGLAILSLIVLRFARSNRKLQAVNMERERIGGELRVASRIQQSMLPRRHHRQAEAEVYGSLVPAREVGGDLYDYFIRDGKLFFCIGDVSGKGAPSAMLMAVTHALFRSASAHESNPARIVQSINETSCQGNESNMFVTLFVGVLDLPTGRLRYCDAGHDTPFVIEDGSATESAPDHHQSSIFSLPCNPHLPVGVFDDMKYVVQETRIMPGTTLFLYTDGLTEAMNEERQLFGLERVKAVLGTCDGQQPQEILTAVTEAVHTFVGDAEQSDDLTMLAIHYTPQQFESVLTETLVLNNDIHEVTRLSSFMKSVAERLGFETSMARQLRLAIEEAVVNVIDYAYPAGTKGDITVRMMSDGHILHCQIIDAGVPFDPTAKEKADTTLSAEDRQIGGLGILLVRELMDSINYERTDGQNVLTLTKKIEH